MTAIDSRLSWPAVEAMLDGMLGRRYYTNHGPLARELEDALRNRAGSKHAVLATNPAIGLIMLLEGLGLSGDVLLSAVAPAGHAAAIRWAGLGVRYCDVEPQGCSLRSIEAAAAAAGCTAAVCAAEDDWRGIGRVIGLPLCLIGWPKPWCPYPALVKLPGLPNGPESGCILTDDDGLARRLRNIRSSYGAGPTIPVTKTANGRVSEAQAGLALLQLDEVFVSAGLALPADVSSRLRPYHGGTAIMAGDPGRRDSLVARLNGMGLQAKSAPPLAEPARHCVNAAAFVAEAVLVACSLQTVHAALGSAAFCPEVP